ncbi:hypothetical protein HDU67_005892 [Dinochytrium kinnereticum]|nr:hypothetical protein HDU67_005892 [Dinochytrium kinnereticum]
MVHKVTDPLVWIDLEMTGLDLEKDHIIEIACIITDGDLKAVEDGPGKFAAECIATDLKQIFGLTASVKASKFSTEEAEAEVLAYIKKHIPEPRVGVLAGNSVHVDKEFLRVHMPNLLEYLHYRIVDVSTIKELAKRWNKSVASGAPKKALSHRALDDIRESILELKYYKKTFLNASK